MRYTEARLTKFTQEVYLADLDKNIVDFGPNFDETEKEPLGSFRFEIPNLLINGAKGSRLVWRRYPASQSGRSCRCGKSIYEKEQVTTKDS